jgi:hypothetical protein
VETSANLWRMVVALLLLVGLVWGVLHAGADLSAPAPLGERWTRTEVGLCAPEATTLTLSQSGVFLDVRWPGGPVEVLRGRLEGERIALHGTLLRCGVGEARLEGTWTPAGLEARVTASGCAACDGARLTATRTAP